MEKDGTCFSIYIAIVAAAACKGDSSKHSRRRPESLAHTGPRPGAHWNKVAHGILRALRLKVHIF
jgi:hypothetical protein